MTKIEKVLAAIAFVVYMTFAFAGTIFANAHFFGPTVQTSSATTSPTYMTPGNATTTMVLDVNSFIGNSATKYRADKALLAVQYAGSSTSAVLKIGFEHSADCGDYYQSFVQDFGTQSTTTAAQFLLNPNTVTMQFASSTLAGAAKTATNQSTTTAMITLPTPTRCTRVVFTLTGASAAIWAQIIPIREM